MRTKVSWKMGKVGLAGAAAPAALLMAVAPGLAWADEQPLPSGEETIVVTARRRAEPLQEVPISVSVVSGDYAAQHNLNDLQDITTAVPAADFRTSSSNKDRTLFIRGIGTISTSPGVEPSVSTVVDGVVFARSGQATLDLVDLDHVEVLEGPQGTLFGKNASAGVVNVVTKEPTDTLHGFADFGYYSGNEYRLDGGVSGPIVAGKLDGMISVLASGYDGNVTNLFNGESVNGYDHKGVRAKLRFTPSDDLTITLAADYLRSEDTVPTGVWDSTSLTAYPSGIVTPNPTLAGILSGQGINASPGNQTVNTNITSGTADDNGGVSATIDWKLGGYTLTSISAYRRWHNVQTQDYDELAPSPGNSLPQIADLGVVDFNQYSEEARVASPKGGLIDYVAGVYYLHAVDGETYNRSELTTAGANPNGTADFGTTGDDYAVFGEGDINFTDRFRGILGLRLVHDDLDYHHQRVTPLTGIGIGPSFTGSGSTSADDYSDRIGLQYDLAEGTMAYFTYSRGYKGPAFNVFYNMAAVNTAPLKPETSDAYEIGLKSSLFDNRLQANLSGFIDDFSNYQANFASVVDGGLVTNLINAGAVSTRGVEAQLTAHPVERLTLDAAVATTVARVDDFACPAGAPVSCDINGKPLPFAPDWRVNARASYVIPLNADFDVTLDTDYAWQSSVQYQLSETPNTIQQPYGIWNGGVTLADIAQGWQVTAVVKNILDTHYSSYLAQGDLGGVVRWVPRDYSRYAGINLHAQF